MNAVDIPKQEYHWSYFNVLEMLLAGMPTGRYTADFGEWAKEIKVLRDKYSEIYPKLLEDINFIELEPLNPYSEELEEFFQRVGATVYNPHYEIMEITEKKRQQLEIRARKRLEDKDIDIIKDMSSEAAKVLSRANTH